MHNKKFRKSILILLILVISLSSCDGSLLKQYNKLKDLPAENDTSSDLKNDSSSDLSEQSTEEYSDPNSNPAEDAQGENPDSVAEPPSSYHLSETEITQIKALIAYRKFLLEFMTSEENLSRDNGQDSPYDSICLLDVNFDGISELLLLNSEAVTRAMVTAIYKYDPSSNSVVHANAVAPATTFYPTGYIASLFHHNWSPGDAVFPTDIYKLDPKTFSLEETFHISSIEKSFEGSSYLDKFPHEHDKDNDGIIYVVNEDQVKTPHYFTKQEFDDYLAQYYNEEEGIKASYIKYSDLSFRKAMASKLPLPYILQIDSSNFPYITAYMGDRTGKINFSTGIEDWIIQTRLHELNDHWTEPSSNQILDVNLASNVESLGKKCV